jgi:hypothetical protein
LLNQKKDETVTVHGHRSHEQEKKRRKDKMQRNFEVFQLEALKLEERRQRNGKPTKLTFWYTGIKNIDTSGKRLSRVMDDLLGNT